jgi:predicted transcriptional regulator
MNILLLHKTIAAVCPITGVSVGDVNDKATWRISFGDSATDQQKTAAAAVVTAFDPTADDTRVQGLNTDSAYLDFVSQLQGKTAAQVKNYVQNNVTDLNSAKTLLAKVLLYIARTI